MGTPDPLDMFNRWSDAERLYRLLEAACDVVQGLPFHGQDGKRSEDLDRADALVTLARDMTEKLRDDLEPMDSVWRDGLRAQQPKAA